MIRLRFAVQQLAHPERGIVSHSHAEERCNMCMMEINRLFRDYFLKVLFSEVMCAHELLLQFYMPGMIRAFNYYDEDSIA